MKFTKSINKITLSALALASVATLAVAPLSAENTYAVSEYKVTKMSVENSTDGEVSVSGTVDAGMLAVACRMFDASENEVAFTSGEVTNDQTFALTLTANVNGDYSVSCADYDGGATNTATITVSNAKENTEATTEDIDAPDTGELTAVAAAVTSQGTIIAVISALLITAGFFLYRRFRRH